MKCRLADERVLHVHPADVSRAGVGARYWRVTLGQIEPTMAYRRRVKRYAVKLHEHIVNGDGLLLHGPHGSGKTSVAVIVIKETLARRGSAYLLDATDLTDAYFGSMYDDERTVREFMEHVDLLVLDDVGVEHSSKFSKAMVERLIRYRSNRKRATVLTTNVPLPELAGRVGSGLMSVISACMYPVLVDGIDWRQREAEALRARLDA